MHDDDLTFEEAVRDILGEIDETDRPGSSSTPAGPWGEAEAPESPAETLGELTRVFNQLLRLLRARQGRGTGAVEALDELHAGLGRLVERLGEVNLRVAVDGLYSGDELILEVSPREDPALFRVFQHGVRHVSFLPGVTREELSSFVEVLSTEFSEVEDVEDDISTLLADRDFEAINFVVVDTFTEADEPQARARAAEIDDIVAAALQRKLGDQLTEAGAASGGAVRFWSADLTFLQESSLRDMVTSLPQEGQQGNKIELEQQAGMFLESLRASMDHYTPWLPGAAFTLLEGAGVEEGRAVAQLLGSEVVGDARAKGLARMLPQLQEIARWTGKRSDSPVAVAVRRAVFSAGLRAVALKALKGSDEETRLAAIFVVGEIPVEERARALAEISRLQADPGRIDAIRRVMEPPGPKLMEVVELIPSMDAEAAAAVLGTLEGEAVRGDLLALHQAALDHPGPRVRALALQWLLRHGDDQAAAAASRGLGDSSEAVRLATLYLLANWEPPFAAHMVHDWFFKRPTLKKADMREKRLAAMVVVKLAGKKAVPRLRKLIHKMNLTGNQHLDEMRAAAVAALGMLGDESVRKKVAKLARSRLCGSALQEEAKLVTSATKVGRRPYAQPLADLVRLALELGLAPPRSEGFERLSLDGGMPAGEPMVEFDVIEGEDSTSSSVAEVEIPPTMLAVIEEREGPTGGLRGRGGREGTGGHGAAAGDEGAAITATPDLVEELLESFSFDDIPLCETELSPR